MTSDFSIHAMQPNTLHIDCECIILAQKSIDLEIDITHALENTDTIIVNGIKFTRSTIE